MKLFCRILIGLMILSSCSKNEEPSKDPIIGKWKYEKLLVGGVDILDECSRQGTKEFFENGKRIITLYEKDPDGNCVVKSRVERFWKKNENRDSWYCYDSSNSMCDKFIFTNNNNTMIHPGNSGHENPEDFNTVYTRIK